MKSGAAAAASGGHRSSGEAGRGDKSAYFREDLAFRRDSESPEHLIKAVF